LFPIEFVERRGEPAIQRHTETFIASTIQPSDPSTQDSPSLFRVVLAQIQCCGWLHCPVASSPRRSRRCENRNYFKVATRVLLSSFGDELSHCSRSWLRWIVLVRCAALPFSQASRVRSFNGRPDTAELQRPA
jgi:hypothetical protein